MRLIAVLLLVLPSCLGFSLHAPLGCKRVQKLRSQVFLVEGASEGTSDAAKTGSVEEYDQIVSLTDENGVNSLIGRKIETPADWLEVLATIWSSTAMPAHAQPCLFYDMPNSTLHAVPHAPSHPCPPHPSPPVLA